MFCVTSHASIHLRLSHQCTILYLHRRCVCVCVLVYYLSALFALASGSEVHHLLKGTANVHFL